MAASSRSLHRLLEELGWACERITGSHHIFTKPGYGCIPVSIHSKNAISRAAFMGTLKRIEERDSAFEERKKAKERQATAGPGGRRTPTTEQDQDATKPRSDSTESFATADSTCAPDTSCAPSPAKSSPEDSPWRLPVVLVEELAHEPGLLAELTAEGLRLRAEQTDEAHSLVDGLLAEVFDLLGIDAFEQAERALKTFFYEHKLFSPGKVLKEMRGREAPGLIDDEKGSGEGDENRAGTSRLNIKSLLSPETLEELDFVLLSTIRARVFRVVDTGFVSQVETDGLWQILALVDDMNAKFWRRSEVVSDKREDMLKSLATRFNARLASEVETLRCADGYDRDGTNTPGGFSSAAPDDLKDLAGVMVFHASVTEAFNFVAETVEKNYLKKHYVVENFGHAFALSVTFLLEDLRTRFFQFREFEKTAGVLDRLLKVFGVPICEGAGRGAGADVGAGFSGGEISPASWYVLMEPSTEDLTRADNELRLAPGALTVKENASAMRKLFLQGLDEGVGRLGANARSKKNASSSSTLASVQAKLILSKQHREKQLADQRERNHDYVLYTPDHCQADLGVIIPPGGSRGKIFFGAMITGLKYCDRKLEEQNRRAFPSELHQFRNGCGTDEALTEKLLHFRKRCLYVVHTTLCEAAERSCQSYSREHLAAVGGWFSEVQVRRQLEKEWGMDPLEGAPEGGKGGGREDDIITGEEVERFFAEIMADEETERNEIAAGKASRGKEVGMKTVDGYVKHGDAAELTGGGAGSKGDSTSSSSAPTVIRATDATTAVAMLQQVELFTACAWYLMELAPVYLQLEAYGLVPFCQGMHAFFPKKGLLQRGQKQAGQKQNTNKKTLEEEGRTRAGKPYIFCVGDRVNVKKLKSKPELNGQRAEVVECVKKSDAETRYVVKLPHVHDTTGRCSKAAGAATSQLSLSLKPENLSLIRPQMASLMQNREAAEQVGYLAPRLPDEEGTSRTHGKKDSLEKVFNVFRAVPDVNVEIAPEVKHDEKLKKLMEDFFSKTEGFARLIFGGDGRSTCTIPTPPTSGATNTSTTTVPGTIAAADSDVLFVPAAQTRSNGELDVKLDAVAATMLGLLAQDVLQATSDVLILLHHNWSSDICTREIPQRVFQLFERHGNRPRHEVFSKYWNEWAPFHNSVMTDLQAWSSSFVTLLLSFRLSFEVEAENENRAGIGWVFHGSAKSSTSSKSKTTSTATAKNNQNQEQQLLESLVTVQYRGEPAYCRQQREREQERMGIPAGSHDVCKFAKSYRLLRWVYLPAFMERVGFLRHKTGPREVPSKLCSLTAVCNEWFAKAVLQFELATTSVGIPGDPAAAASNPKYPIIQWIRQGDCFEDVLEQGNMLLGVFGYDDKILQLKADTERTGKAGRIAWAYNNAPKWAFLKGNKQIHVGAGPSMRFYHQGIMKKGDGFSSRLMPSVAGSSTEAALAGAFKLRCTFEVQFYACIQLEDFFLQEIKSEALAVTPVLESKHQPKNKGLQIGSLVKVENLKSASGKVLNGKLGCVEGKIAATGRWSVLVAGSGKKALNVGNVELVEEHRAALNANTNTRSAVLSMHTCIPAHCAYLRGYQDAAVFDSMLFGRKEDSVTQLAVEALTWKLLRLVLLEQLSSSTSKLISAKTLEKFVTPIQSRAKGLLPLLLQRRKTVNRLKFFRTNCLLGFKQIPKTSKFWDFKTITDCLTGQRRESTLMVEFAQMQTQFMPECREQEVCDLLSDLKHLAQSSERLKVELQPVFGGDFLARLKTVELKAAIGEIGKAIGCGVGEVDDGAAVFGGESDMKAAGGGCKANGSSFAPPPRMNATAMNDERDPLVQKYLELKCENSEWTNKQLAEEMGISTEKLKRIAREAKKHLNM